MNLAGVIEGLVEERGLNREQVVSIVCEGVLSAYRRKYPQQELSATFDKKSSEVQVFVQKKVVSSVVDEDVEISTRRARAIKSTASVGDVIAVPLEGQIGRIEVQIAKQVIASKIRELEHSAVAKEFGDKQGLILSGTAHKHERGGYAIKISDVMAFLPNRNCIPEEAIRVGSPIRILLKEVLEKPRGDYQLVLDRASAEFVQKLLEIEIPEIFEGIVEIKNIVRAAGYKTKVVVSSNRAEIDPVGTCVGVGGVRIKPILRELGGEKIDLVEWTDDVERLVKNALKPAEIDKVELSPDGEVATVWLAQDQRSLAIGKMGRNIMLAARLCGVDIRLQEVASSDDVSFSSEEVVGERGNLPEESSAEPGESVEDKQE